MSHYYWHRNFGRPKLKKLNLFQSTTPKRTKPATGELFWSGKIPSLVVEHVHMVLCGTVRRDVVDPVGIDGGDSSCQTENTGAPDDG